MELPSPDWSELPSDVLGVVVGKLEFPDVFRFSAVCTSWHASGRRVRRDGYYSRPQTPCLLYTTASDRSGAAELYSLTDRKAYAVRLPDPPIQDRYIIGSSHGWLVTADARSELHLLNPATGEQLRLPSITTIEQVRPLLDEAGNLDRYELFHYDGRRPRGCTDLRAFFYLKAIVSSDPSRGRGDYTVMLMHHPENQLSFARAGDKHWTWVKFDNSIWFADCIYHAGVFYAQTFTGAIHAIDVGRDSFTHGLILKKSIPRFCNVYIVRTPEGDILQLLRITSTVEKRERTATIEVYKVNLEKQGVGPIDSLGDNAVFIGTSYSSCLPVKDYPQLMPNHIYCDDDDEYWLREKDGCRDVGVYDFEEDHVNDLVSPQPWLNWPPPIWITPSFTKIVKVG
ncbi:probable F-box protein At1g65740 [Triticum dicoccoides]|uniref:probable F-box protein At1g65740 n=1 Tax=Triticum dicoccoides TaxID=85692 RepID=UPI001891F009|nr:probable F-box protein At1g65740 [Triticum dicoccoides]